MRRRRAHRTCAPFLCSAKHNKWNHRGCGTPVGGSALSVGGGGGGLKLHVLTVSWGWGWQLPVVPLRRSLAIALRGGLGGVSADAKGNEAVQAVVRPGERGLGLLGRSHHGGVQLSLRQPRRDLHLRYGLQVRHEGRVHDSSCTHQTYVMEETTASSVGSKAASS